MPSWSYKWSYCKIYIFIPKWKWNGKKWDDFNVLETVYKSSMHLEVFKRSYQIVAKSGQSVVGCWRRSGALCRGPDSESSSHVILSSDHPWCCASLRLQGEEVSKWEPCRQALKPPEKSLCWRTFSLYLSFPSILSLIVVIWGEEQRQ